MMLSHFLKLELRSDMSIKKPPDGVGLQQFQHKPGWNAKILVDLSTMKLDFQKRSGFLVADPSQLRRLDLLPQHAILRTERTPETGFDF
jgi:hypothetical protein